jgi:hypothetical protein
LGLEPKVVAALAQLFIVGERAGEGQMPHVVTTNGVRVGLEPGAEAISLSYGDMHCLLDLMEARELVTMIIAAAEAAQRLELIRHNRSQGAATAQELRAVLNSAGQPQKSAAE